MAIRRHKQIKNKMAGKKGQTEVKIQGGRRIDVKKGRIVGEIERSGRIRQALLRLKTQKTFKKILRVPHKDLDKAVREAKKIKIKVLITNLGNTKRRIVK